MYRLFTSKTSHGLPCSTLQTAGQRMVSAWYQGIARAHLPPRLCSHASEPLGTYTQKPRVRADGLYFVHMQTTRGGGGGGGPKESRTGLNEAMEHDNAAKWWWRSNDYGRRRDTFDAGEAVLAGTERLGKTACWRAPRLCQSEFLVWWVRGYKQDGERFLQVSIMHVA